MRERHLARLTGVFLAGVLTAGLAAPRPVAAATCSVPLLDDRYRVLRPVPAERMVPTRGLPSTPPPNPGVGDSWVWYTWDQTGFPVATQKVCTVRGEGEHAYIVVEDSQWLTNVDQADVDRMLLMWDHQSLGSLSTQGIHEICTSHFGPVPDELDGNPKVFVLLYDFPFNALGFVWPYDRFPDGTQSFASNECETLYIDSATLDPGSDYMISVQAHELAHLIHQPADPDELKWIDEGLGELAMSLFGQPDGVSEFPANPDNNLVTWSFSAANYAKAHLWMLYFFDHFGGADTIRQLVAEPANSVTGVRATLTARGYATTFADLMRDWTIANWVDDATLGPQYEYASEDFPAFAAAATHSSYPVTTTNGSVNHWAADYVRLVDGEPQRLFFDGDDTSAWSVSAISFAGGSPSEVAFLPLDANGQGHVDLTQFGPVHDEVVLVVTNVTANGGLNYQYWTETIGTGVPPGSLADASPAPGAVKLATEAAHPALGGETRLALRLGSADRMRLDVVAVDGSLVRRLHDGVLPRGESHFAWDGRDSAGRAAAAGSYWVRAHGTSGEASLRVVRIR